MKWERSHRFDARAEEADQVVDPTGLGGDRICRLTPEGATKVVELWLYSTTRDFDVIVDAHRLHWRASAGAVSAIRDGGR